MKFQIIMLIVALGFALISYLTGYVFLRPVPVQQSIGVIKSITHKPEGTHWQHQVGTNRGFRTPVEITVAERYVLEIYCEELDLTGHYSINVGEQDDYQVGQLLKMNYERRGLPFIGYKTMVLSIETE